MSAAYGQLIKKHGNNPTWFPSDDDVNAAAVEKVKLMLMNSEQLSRLPFFRAEYESNLEQVQAQIRAAVRQQMDETRQGRDSLRESVQLIRGIQENFTIIHNLCGLDSKLRKNQEIARVNIVDTNTKITKKLQSVVNGIPNSVKAANELLAREEFVEAYLQLRKLAKLKSSLQKEGSSAVAQEVSVKFRPVDELGENLLKEIVNTLVACFDLASGEPDEQAVLVNALQVVALEDSSTTSNKMFPQEEGMLLREHIQLRMDQQVCALFTNLMSETKKGEKHESKKFKKIFQRLDEFVEELNKVKVLSPCFPPEYDIEQFFITKYSIYIKQVLQSYTLDMSCLRLEDMLMLVTWIDTFHVNMIKNFPDNEMGEMLNSLGPRMVGEIMDFYTSEAKRIAEPQLASAMRVEDEPLCNAEGQYITTLPQDLFTIVSMHIELVMQAKLGGHGIKCACEMIRDLFLFHQSMLATLLSDVTPSEDGGRLLFGPQKIYKEDKFICAVINNCALINRSVAALEERIIDDLEDREVPLDDAKELKHKARVTVVADDHGHKLTTLKENLEHCFIQITEGYDSVALTGTKMLAYEILLGLGPLQAQLFTKEWEPSADVTRNLLQTIDDYFKDYQVWVGKQSMFGKVVHAVLKSVVSGYVKLLIEPDPTIPTQKARSKLVLTPALIGRLKEDCDLIKEMFESYQSMALPKAIIEKEVSLINIFCLVIGVEVDMGMTVYPKFFAATNKRFGRLKPLEILKILVTARTDLNSAQRDTMLKDFRDKFQDPEEEKKKLEDEKKVLSQRNNDKARKLLGQQDGDEALSLPTAQQIKEREEKENPTVKKSLFDRLLGKSAPKPAAKPAQKPTAKETKVATAAVAARHEEEEVQMDLGDFSDEDMDMEFDD